MKDTFITAVHLVATVAGFGILAGLFAAIAHSVYRLLS